MARIYQTFNITESHLVAHITQVKGKADLCVYVVPNKGLAYGDERWFISKDKGDADKFIFFGSQGQSALNIYFVKTLAEAGWQTNHRLKGQLK